MKRAINIKLIHFQKRITLISKNKIKGESRCAICFTKRFFIDGIKYDLENALEVYLINIKHEKKCTIKSYSYS